MSEELIKQASAASRSKERGMLKSSRGHPVHPCTVGDIDSQPIGRADSARQAARMINKFLEGRDGDDYSLTEDDMVFSAEHSAFFIAE